MDSLGWYTRAWFSGSGLADLHLTDAERAGRYDRVTAIRLLQFPAFSRVLAGIEPYTALCAAVRTVVADPAAVLEYPYDWRLPVAHTATRLARDARVHLEAWRAHPTCQRAQRGDPDGRPARLVFIAHSMGGLLVRYLHTIPGAADDVRTTITLGTPFYGSVKATVMLNAGRGAPDPAAGEPTFDRPARRP